MFSRFLSKSVHGNAAAKESCDVVIVGGGIIGLATARELLIRHPGMRAKVLEKESQLATHQSCHNSGVIHAGLYYPAGSYKAKMCWEGLSQTYAYCDHKQIPYKKCGKLIVAVEMWELPVLEKLMKNATINGIPDVRMIARDGIGEVEPYCRGLRAVYSPHTGIVNWKTVAIAYKEDFSEIGGEVETDYTVTQIGQSVDNVDYPISVKGRRKTSDGKKPAEIQCKYLITCVGLQADHLAKMTGCSSEPQIVPFRGDFMVLKPHKNYLVRGNIYPVPDPRFPFLGLHVSPGIDGTVLLGPNAVLSLKREGYGLFDFSLKDTLGSLTYPGLLSFGFKYYRIGWGEWVRSVSIRGQMKQLKRLIPSISSEDVTRGPSGLRAQTIDRKGNLVDDFVIHQGKGLGEWRVMHVRCVPSPGATSSLPIARHIINEAEKQFDWPTTIK
ncbi:Mitochondrial L-2-hydroxyglutarate dehydrogenase [Fasciola hepatica]|uniref:L-2-hydroxyglutarate dehydrogenase, mitochondrial n=1 Tax=Fasciola hepatica TaxID=6192 RepID=A0A2H1BYY6_FASHE|nr:Mitochondrial L-2-hydroxyglutarate dehydrogenase [Fasciola hepatica]